MRIFPNTIFPVDKAKDPRQYASLSRSHPPGSSKPLTASSRQSGALSTKDEREVREDAGPPSEDQEPGPKAQTTGQGERRVSKGEKKKKIIGSERSAMFCPAPFEGSAAPDGACRTVATAAAAMFRARGRRGGVEAYRCQQMLALKPWLTSETSRVEEVTGFVTAERVLFECLETSG
ncbi:hypothetical protein HPB50_003187 [Hyalomma asiaticum]|uniref:Uncharacterized protein n=1 Tax=Hyalomma asiaticum TaxID=266040 RepID=A0ACB7S2K0_HYAAI|nr:hypothetical protein HPB50_003187 [Hyalomma asiaticum]